MGGRGSIAKCFDRTFLNLKCYGRSRTQHTNVYRLCFFIIMGVHDARGMFSDGVDIGARIVVHIFMSGGLCSVSHSITA